MWLLDRLSYVSQTIGLKWADGVAATLKGDFHIYESLLEEGLPEQTAKSADLQAWDRANAPWTKAIERAGRGAQFLIEKPSPLSDALAEESGLERKKRGPIWLGAMVRRDQNFKLTKVAPSILREGIFP